MTTDTVATNRETSSSLDDPPVTTQPPGSQPVESPAGDEAGGQKAAVVNGTLCTHCDAYEDWDGGTFCPACGYHPRLKRCVDVPSAPVMESGPENLWEAIPGWCWVLLGGVLAIVGASIAVRMQLVDNPRMRAGWAFTQIALAEFVTLIMHVLALIHASSKSDRYSPFDLFLKPIDLWKPTFQSLPGTAWRVWIFAWGQTAMICAVAVIGGVSYGALFDDWGVEKRTEANLVQAIADQAKKNGDDPESLEDSLNQAGGASDAVTGDEPAPPTDNLTAECLIIGYRKTSKGEITSLLLATTVRSRMKYVGLISTFGMPDDVLKRIAGEASHLERKRPFVRCRVPAVWLDPKLMCEVEFESWATGDRLRSPRFRSMLADIKLR